jgi:hypothetical protein
MHPSLELSSPSMEAHLNDDNATPATSYNENNRQPSNNDKGRDVANCGEYSFRQQTTVPLQRDMRPGADHNVRNTKELSREKCARFGKQMRAINKEQDATKDVIQEPPIHRNLTNEEEEEGISYRLPDPDRIDDAAAISVMFYLLLIAFLLAIAILIGTLVVSQYGFVVLVFVVIAIAAMLLVFVVVMSVISGDRKLNRARSQIEKWSIGVRDVILREMADLREDLAAYSSGILLLTYDGDFHDTTAAISSDYIRDNFDNKKNTLKQRRKPKSTIFRLVISPIKKMSRKSQGGGDSSTGKKRSWFRKKNGNVDDEESFPPSENFQVV